MTTPGFLRADAHIHLFRDPGELLPRAMTERYEHVRARVGIDAALVVAFEGTPSHASNSDDVLALSHSRAWLKPLLYLDPARPIAGAELARALEAGYVGVALYLNEPGTNIESWGQQMAPVLADRIVSINSTPETLAGLEALVALLHASHVLISHIGNPGTLLRSGAPEASVMRPLLALTEYSHVSIKLSGLYDIDEKFPHTAARASTTRAIDAFGPERVLWGSDYPVALGLMDETEAFAVPDWVSELLSLDELRDVLGENLNRILRTIR